MSGVDPPSLELLQAKLADCYQQICVVYGHASAVQAVGKLLSAPSPAKGSTPFAATIAADKASAPHPEADKEAELEETDSFPACNDDAMSESAMSEEGSGIASLHLAARPAKTGGLLGKGGKLANRWQKAVQIAANQFHDPWESRQLHSLPMEHCRRLRYNSTTGEWVKDDVLVKMEVKPFAAGAMRECFAMKKRSTFSSNVYHDWKKAQNCVAKRYKKGAGDKVYFTDVLVQMDAKVLGEEYNKTDPPKKVDVLQCAVLQFPDRPGQPLYCVEQLIEGDYVKYNSNSGFVRAGEELLRHTPQAFSHYTFEISHGYKICVDIQGVGDLYTDPQIHTLDGDAYGEGNLGVRGMALFFRSHECNELCTRLHLRPFGRCESDIKAQGYTSDSASMDSAARTLARSAYRRRGSFQERLKQRTSMDNERSPAAKQQLMESLKGMPMYEHPRCLVHLEVAKLYSEVVLLPEIRPNEDPEDALKGAVFHLQYAASRGCLVALCMLARVHAGLEPTVTSFAHLAKRAVQLGELQVYPDMAFRYALLAAERGVKAAQMAVAHAYATGAGLGEHLLEEPQPAEAVRFYKLVLEHPWDEEGARTIRVDDEEQDIIGSARTAAPGRGSDDGEGSEEGAAASTTPDANLNRRLSLVTKNLSTASRDSGASETERRLDYKQYDACAVTDLPVCKDFLDNMRLHAEEEASGLPGGSDQRYEVMAHLGKLLMEGGAGLEKDYAAAATYYTQAAETAEAAFKAKLSMKYYELAAEAEGMIEE